MLLCQVVKCSLSLYLLGKIRIHVLNLIYLVVWFADVVRDDPTNNVPDAIFSKLGMQLHMRDHHPLGILKNAIYDYFDANYSNKFDKFDNLCPIVSTKEVWWLRNIIETVCIFFFTVLGHTFGTYIIIFLFHWCLRFCYCCYFFLCFSSLLCFL